jgi:SAM-dependent methyltransferase
LPVSTKFSIYTISLDLGISLSRHFITKSLIFFSQSPVSLHEYHYDAPMDETTKTKLFYPELFRDFVKGDTLDIGAGQDPVSLGAIVFDKQQGNAEKIFEHFKHESFDSVFSSHCLEHINEPTKVIRDWFALVKPGGHLFVIVPDEDLYEQGHFPSIFNSDHKSTFTISKSVSWSSKSVNLLDIAQDLNGEIAYLKQQSDRYDYSLKTFSKLGLRKFRIGSYFLRFIFLKRLFLTLHLIPVDQTSLSHPVLAQNCMVIKKNETPDSVD